MQSYEHFNSKLANLILFIYIFTLHGTFLFTGGGIVPQYGDA